MKSLLSYQNFTKIIVAGAVLLASLGFASVVVAQSSCGASYTVQPGDYLMKIARLCGVNYADLLMANPNLTNPSLLFPGQVLNILASENPATGSKPDVYTVQKGDTLFSIGRHFNLNVAEIGEANPGVSSAIAVGQVLNIPARISFATGGTSAILQAKLTTNSKHYYLLNAGASQTLEVTLSGPADFSLAIFGADGSTIESASNSLSFRGVLPKTQDYILVVASSATAMDYSLSVDIPLRIRFATGSTSANLTGTVPDNLSQFFILRAAQGQTLNVTATPDDKLQLIIYGVDGSVLRSGMGQGASFSGVLPSTQDYILVLRSANQVQAFTLNVAIPAAPPAPATGSPSYTVLKGDTLFSIAIHFQTTVNALLRANPDITNPNLISVGQVIYLPGATLKLSNGKTVYIAKTSDTMGIIAQKFSTTLGALINANPQISNPNLIFPGQRINIP